MRSKLYRFFAVFLVFRCSNVVSDTKSNVAFVIDDTGSMQTMIDEVKDKVIDMFNNIYESSSSLIGDFILVTFNDYEVHRNGRFIDDKSRKPIKVRAITKDPNIFLEKLEEINVGGGGRCPELCFEGIKTALENCNPYSYIYVFTDASPRDFFLKDIVRNLAQQKSIQITFLLAVTTNCGVADDSEYKEIAKSTSGEMFHLINTDTSEIMNYIIYSLRNRQTPLLTASIPPGKTNINFTGDIDMHDVSIKVNVHSNATVNLNVTGLDGNKPSITNLVDIPYTKVVQLPKPGNGSYVASMDATDTGEISIKATVSVDFKHGFSLLNPSSLKNTKTRPVPDEESYLAIQLTSTSTGTTDAKLKLVKILDIDDKVENIISVDVINEKENIYVTKAFKPPNHIFKIAIEVVDTKTNSIFTRIGRTPIQPQSLPTEKLNYMRPKITIENIPIINVTYGESITLVCKVKAYPMPTIVWEDKKTGLQLPSKVAILELPDEFISLLEIKNVTKVGSYECKAIFSINDTVTDFIEVKPLGESFLKVLIYPKDTTIDYEKEAKIYCKINAWPSGYVGWYKDDKELIQDDNFEISDDKATLFVKKMKPELKGSYSFRFKNKYNSLVLSFTLNLSGVDGPKINKTESSKTVTEGSKIDIVCSIIKGLPKPVITWEVKEKDTDQFKKLAETEQVIHINAVALQNAGVYKCVATNIVGQDNHEILLNVHYPPVIFKNEKTKTAIKGTKTMIVCSILRGTPQPMVTWKFKRQNALEFVSFPVTGSYIILNPVKVDDAGVYKCYAKNVAGEDSHAIDFTVNYAPTVNVKPLVTAKIGETETLSCEVIGEPNPDVRWIRDGIIIQTIGKYTIYSDNSLGFEVSVDDKGNYTCDAQNVLGRDSKNATLDVYDPVKIDSPKETILNIDVGKNIELQCNASGIPEPNITWVFFSVNPNILSQILLSKNKLLPFVRIQAKDAGFYICTANNGYNNKSLTYQVTVNLDVEIKRSAQTEFDIVPNDLALIIPCKATGYPIPNVAWIKDFVVLTMAYPYSMDSNNSLIITNPTMSEAGTYLCVANNNKTSAYHLFTVKYTMVPETRLSSVDIQTVYIKFGRTKEIPCNLPRKSSDITRWYTDQNEMPTKTFIIHNAQRRHSRVYTCRLSTLNGSQNAQVKVEVGDEPVFENMKSNVITVAFFRGRLQSFECYVKGVPSPTITWWHNGKHLDELSTLYEINGMDDRDIGTLRCEAKNPLGTITRTYEIKISGCKVNYAENETTRFHPVLLSKYTKLEFENENGSIIIPENEKFEILCPNSIRKGYCVKNEYIIINNTLKTEQRYLKYDDLKCDTEVEPTTANLNSFCGPNKEANIFHVGYKRKQSFHTVYNVCFNQRAQKQYYVKYKINRYASNIKIGSHSFVNHHVNYIYEDMFDCDNQRRYFRDLPNKEECCFLRKQLVSPEDVAPGVQKSTYININVVPQWNFCGNDLNSDDVERRIRNLSKSIHNNLEVFSGEFQSQNLYLNDNKGNRKAVPKYLWKVVTMNTKKNKALAIITINVPYLTLEEAKKLVFCEDICRKVDWLEGAAWQDVSKGYTFCCEAPEFEKNNPIFDHLFVSSSILFSKNINDN